MYVYVTEKAVDTILETSPLSSQIRRLPYYLMSSLFHFFIFAILTLRLMTLALSWATRFIYISWLNLMPKSNDLIFHKSHIIDTLQNYNMLHSINFTTLISNKHGHNQKFLVTCETNTTTQQLDASSFCILEYFPSSTIRCFSVVKGNNKYHIIWRMQ